MGYELDLQTKKKGKELDALWSSIKDAVMAKFNSVPKEEFSSVDHETVERWCEAVAKDLGLAFRRDGDWLCFMDKALASN